MKGLVHKPPEDTVGSGEDGDERCVSSIVSFGRFSDIFNSSLLEFTQSSLSSDPPMPLMPTTERFWPALRNLNETLERMRKQWDTAEKHKLLGEKAKLEDTAYKLNAGVRIHEEGDDLVIERG
jgi:hypothetical protein